MDMIYQQGEVIQPNCSTRCVCQSREFVCETIPCVADGATCTVSGYSHYQTFDLQTFTFQGDCEYVLTTPCDSDEFIITVHNERHNEYVSCISEVNITIPSESVFVILKRNHAISINNVLQPVSDIGVVMSSSDLQVLRVGGNVHVILLTHNITLFWDGLYRVEVTVSTTWQNRLCGLCGNYNSIDSDEFRMPDSTLVTSENEFATSWITGNTSNCGILSPTPRCLGTAVLNAINACNLLMRSVFTGCNALVDPLSFHTYCVYDYCNCHTDRNLCLCESLAIYASACSRAGIILSTWRDSFCREYLFA